MGIFSKFRSGGSVQEEDVLKKLSKVQDPDLHRDLVSLGFIKDVQIKSGRVSVVVQLTTPACPAKEQLQQECEAVIKEIPGVEQVEVTMTAPSYGNSGSQKQANPTEHPALAKVRHIIAVASGKGGVGKSTTTVNLAYALAQEGAKVGILDADIYGPSIPRMTAVDRPTAMEGELILPPVKDGIKIISAEMFSQQGQAQILRGPLVAQIIRQLLTQVAWGELDYLLVDYPPGTGDIQLTLSQVASLSGAVIVTTPQEIALLDVRKAIQMFQTLNVPLLGIVETMSFFVCDGCDKEHEIFPRGGGRKLAEQFGIPLLGEVPMDPRLAHCADRGETLIQSYPDSPGAVVLKEASRQMVREQAKIDAKGDNALTQFRLEWS
ncbi:MAG: Mrp/NBP35 family ATP-binding protein [Oligoflexus sp.]